MSPLEKVLKQKIERDGPMDVATFMSLALGHPEHGYYMKHDPFGLAGDFTTAPEVSQLFGEMIGVWVADVWGQMGSPARFILLECGPGRGTLMADILRATKTVTGFHEAAEIHLLEMSAVLRARQSEALRGYDPHWHDDLSSVPDDAPIIVIGNEFLDALPFHQFVKTDLGRVERRIALKDGVFVFMPKDGVVVEASPQREEFIKGIASRLKAQSGAALFIDYGHLKSGQGDTFQAVKGHEYVDMLSHIGDADLTSHVDFEALQKVIDVQGVATATQGDFLKALGVEVRAQILMKNAMLSQAQDVEKGLHRLVDSDQMGELFKVLAFWNTHDTTITNQIKPAGF